MTDPRHLWVRLSRRIDPADLAAVLPDPLPPALVAPLDANRRSRGPFTATGGLVRALADDFPARVPELTDRHLIEVLSVAPELRETLPASRETLTSLAVPRERTRFHSRLRVRRLGHGVVELLHGHLRALGGGPRSLVVHVVDADPTDLEFLAALVRRTDPALLTVVVCDAGTTPGAPLADVLAAHAVQRLVEPPEDDPAPRAGTDDLASATRYVDADGTVELPHLVAAYDRLPAEDRARLHDRRADELVAAGEFSHTLGAIPWHRERGGDHAAAVAALVAGLDHCVDMGFYDATVDFGRRGRAMIAWREEPNNWWVFTTKMTASLSALGRPEEAEALYGESGLLNQAIAFAELIFQGRERAFQVVFNRNGLALVESHLGNLPEALRLVTEGLEWLDAVLEPGEHALHRSVLTHNRGEVLSGPGRPEEALACYDAVIAADPNHPDHHLDRGNALHRLGRDDEALAAYETAIRLGPPFPEAEYNRVEPLLDAGAEDEALAGLDHVLDLDPEMVDAYVNRAGVHLDRGDLDRARRDVDAGLALDPADPHLLAALGQVLAEAGDGVAARAAFDRALAEDPDLVTALAGRAAVAHGLGDTDAAIADLDAAVVRVPDDPALRFNRAVLYEAARRWDDALADLAVAARSAPDDEDIAEALTRCRAAVPA